MSFSKKIFLISALFLLCFNVLNCQQKYYDAGDFILENGEKIENCRIAYQTFGKLNKERSNAVLAPLWFMGSSFEVKNFFCGEESLYDTTNYFVIAVDPFGNGVSSSPSNSNSQPGDAFPHFTITDMINAQYVLLTGELGISHLHAIVGLSMGGMQAYQWAVMYPDFSNKIVSINGTPSLTSYGKLLWTTELRIIELLRECKNSDEKTMQIISGLQTLLFKTPEYVIEKIDEPAMYLFNNDGYYKAFDPLDWQSQIKAFMDLDLFSLPKSKLRDIIRSEILVVVSLRDHVVNPEPSIEFAESFDCRLLKYDSPYGHQIWLDPESDLNDKVKEFLKK